MASKYTEAYLGVRFRVTDHRGNQMGGPQVYLNRGIPGALGKTLAFLFALFAAIAVPLSVLSSVLFTLL